MMSETAVERGVLRAGRVEDHGDFVRLFEELGVEEAAPPLDAWVSELVKRSFFVDGDGGAEAYALIDVLGQTGYVVNLVVAPHARRRGLGRRVMRELARVFRSRGCEQWMLYVKPDNAPALALYEAMGMRAGCLETTWRLSRRHLEALPPVPEGLEVLALEERDFAAMTQTFGLVPGKLTRFAAQRGLHQMSRLVDPRLPESAGWMDLRPLARALIPFFAVTPAHARALLEVAFLELEDAEHLRVVTGDAALGALFQAAGAHTVMETLHMRGPLPT